MVRPLIRPIPAHSMARQPFYLAPSSISYVNNTIEARDPAGPKWLNFLLRRFASVELTRIP